MSFRQLAFTIVLGSIVLPSRAVAMPDEQLFILGGVRDLHQSESFTVHNVGDVDFANHEDSWFGGLEFATHDSEFGFEAGVFYSNTNERASLAGSPVDVDLTMFEVTVGGRYTFDELGDLRPFVGGGADFVFYETDVDRDSLSASLDRTDFGLYAHAGAHYHFDNDFSIGFDVRGLFGTADNLDYVQYAAVVGLSF